jgi:FlaA1/EpsC-like NDP-sugar epimerase
VRSRVIIYGAGEAGLITKRTIDQEAYAGMSVVAFIDDDKNKSGKKLEGANIYHTRKAEELFASGKIDEIIISIQKIDPDRKSEMINLALKYNITVLNVPPVRSWINGELSLKQIRTIKIENLLERDTIKLDSTIVRAQVAGKRVLVTGAAGSIGSELVRQILAYEPARLITLDQAETPMHELELEVKSQWKDAPCEYVVGDVRRNDRIQRMFEAYQPQIVFHAAAYKHVPLMEENPSEAVLANVLGTKNLVDVADKYGVETFVLISTDKAVNPTSVMGASKRVAEIYAQSKNAQSKTAFITTRFGNVLGSNGSVVQLFKKQIEDGGPVTVTHSEVTRYFMTIPEAVQLVLEAGAMGTGGEIFVFDMGQSVKIVDLARNMIKLSGLVVDKDIEIKITGLRPGEKLYEELLTDEENTVATHHPKILIAKVREYDHVKVQAQVQSLIDMFDSQDNDEIVLGIKKIVPEYVSENSEYSKLDG